MNANSSMAIVHEVFLNDRGSERLTGFNLERPAPGSTYGVYAIPIQGWVLPDEGPARGIWVREGRDHGLYLPVSTPRPDLAVAEPEIPWARETGFSGHVSTLDLPEQFELGLTVDLGDGESMWLGRIRGEREPLAVDVSARFSPVMVTTLGRTGSVWLTWLLGRHPQVIAYRPFDYEPKVASYFAELIKNLSQPASYLTTLTGTVKDGDWWLGREPPSDVTWQPDDSAVEDWLGKGYVEEIVTIFAGRIDAFYRHIASLEAKPSAGCFVEKYNPQYFAQRLLWEIYPRAREIFLVRDFRDVFCSIRAYTEKRELNWMRAAGDTNDHDFVRHTLGGAVSSLLESWRERSERSFLVKYEELVMHPEQTLSPLFSYLDVESSPEAVELVLAEASRLDPEEERFHRTSVGDAESIGRWRRELDPSLGGVCEEVFGEALAEFGYAPS